MIDADDRVIALLVEGPRRVLTELDRSPGDRCAGLDLNDLADSGLSIKKNPKDDAFLRLLWRSDKRVLDGPVCAYERGRITAKIRRPIDDVGSGIRTSLIST